MRALLRLLSERGSWPRLGLFLASGLVAFLVGFVVVPTTALSALIIHGGYYYILGLFVLFVIHAHRVLRERRAQVLAWLRSPGWIGLAVVLGTGVALWSDTFAHKVLFDEYVLQGTAWHMHATKEVATPIRAYDFAGTWLAIDTFLDKRPYFFVFLISLLHDLAGFRLENVYVLNALLAGTTLGLVAWLVHALTRSRAAAVISVALLATLPVFGQNATGASMELHNLAMLAMVMVAGVLYLKNPDGLRLGLLIFATALLAQSRYESVLFVLPVAAVIVIGWLRRGSVLLPWSALVAPLLFIPYAWHDRFVSANPALWQLREGDSGRFGWQYLAGNLEGARAFFFSTTSLLPSSLALTLLGSAGVVWACACMIRRSRPPAGETVPWSAAAVVLFAFGLTVAANLALLMFYYWSRLDDPVATRFALPTCLMLSVLAGWWLQQLHRRGFPAFRWGWAVLGLWLVTIGAPAYARRLYTQHNLVMHELHWELEVAQSRPGRPLIITNKATMPYLLRRIPAVNTGLARGRGAQIAWHLEQGTFDEVLLVQVLRPTTAQGDLGVDPDDVVPASFHLEPLATKRFGARFIRVSRVVGFEATPSVSPAGQ